ncbi:M28 family peptidase [Candidatus Poribacteria bacterium]|nr:M28 family peptidase [Candidatus Poribacteria bacterium]MYG07910.1 M28 family peptidase [Candidatus Poribacteria bacterium]MYK21910.1 M28 family peptidase [Candidatus Poribacteria bacterium]
MHTSHTYDAQCASHHITQLAIPRLVGSAGEAETQDYIVEQFTELGLDVSWEPFVFTKFPAEVLPRILSALFLLIILTVPWFGERFPIPVCFACVLSLTIAMFFTQWQKRLEGLYDVGRRHRTENIIATNNANRDNNTPVFLFVAHYDSKSQVLPIAVRMMAYGIAIVGLIALTIVMLVKVIALIWLPNYIVWGLAGITSFCLLLLQINLTENRSPGGFDNASGVGVMLEVARVMMARDEEKSVMFLATGAEEYGMCGALRYIQAHADEYDQENTYVINLDGLGVGNGVNLITRYGIPPTRTTRTLRNLFQTSSEALGIEVSERYLPIGVGLDSIPIASRGFETVTLTARGVGSVALKVHSKQDQSELLNAESLQQVGELIVDVIESA